MEQGSLPPQRDGSLLSRLRPLYRRHFGDPRRERQFLSSIGFFVAFAITRAITHAIRAHRRPLHRPSFGRRRPHHHHLVWGILSLLGVGYAWLLQVGTGIGRASPWGSRSTAVLYGIGSAVTLDEFALWLNLEDVYWARQGRESIDAVVLFGAVLSIGAGGGPFLRALARELTRGFKG